MAEELYETDERAQKAWRKILAAIRKLAKGELVDAVANAGHTDASVREMRRYEALAALLESLVAEDDSKSDKSKSK